MGDLKLSNWIPAESDGGKLTKKEEEYIFNRGAVISIKHQSIFEPVLTVIQKAEGHNIYFRIPETFLKNNVLRGDHVSCHIMQGDYEYVVYGLISEIEINYPWLVEVVVKKISKFRNSRRTKRYLVNFQAKVFPKDIGKNVYAIIKNISMTGVGAVFREDIEPESLVNVAVSASINKAQNLEFKAKITRVIGRELYNEYGLEIVDIDDHNKNMLDKLIYRLECDEGEFVSESLK